MNKAELIQAVAEASGQTKASTETVLNGLLETVSDALAKGDSVNLVGFGSFKVSERAARQGRNPQSGEVVDIPAQVVPKFVAGKSLKEKVAKGK